MDRRLVSIMEILLNSNKPVTINSLAKTLDVSNKTIRNDLKVLEKWLSETNLILEKKPGVGTRIIGDEADKLRVLDYVEKKANYIEDYSPEDRKIYILKKLFMNNSVVTIEQLAKDLYVSRATVHKDLSSVEEWLNERNIKLLRKTGHGIKIKASETHLRKALSDLLCFNKDYEELKEFLEEPPCSRIDNKSLVQLENLLEIDFYKLEEILLETEKKLNYGFSDEAFLSLIIHIAIAIKRLHQGKDIILDKNTLIELKNQSEYEIAYSLANDIEEAFGISFPPDEIGYLLLHILGTKANLSDNHEVSVQYLKSDEGSETKEIAEEIIYIAERSLGVNLSNDEQLLNGLVLHLRPVINRIKYGLEISNPLLDNIKSTYPEIYGVAWLTSPVFKKHFGVNINEGEIGYIALHLGAAVERLKKPLRTIVVCHSGVGTSQLLSDKLESTFQQLEIIGIKSSTLLSQSENINDVDLIVSTVPLNLNLNIPIITISPLLSKKDISSLNIIINQIYESKNKLNLN